MANQTLLQKGDVIRLEKGMQVYVRIPEKFVNANAPFSCTPVVDDIRIGRVLVNSVPEKNVFIDELAKHLKTHINYNGVTTENVTAFIDSLNLNFSTEKFDTSIYIGEYRVIDAGACGGGFHIDMNKLCYSPGDWLVACTKIDDPSKNVLFYQTGHFTATIPDIKPIRHETKN